MSDSSPPASPSLLKQPQFRLRGNEINRIEAVSDVVFGFALTLLVVSLQVPASESDEGDMNAYGPVLASLRNTNY